METLPSILTEDGVLVDEGDFVYNYYDMWPGTIVAGTKTLNGQRDNEPLNRNQHIWFDLRADDGRVAMLNGQRICSIAFAKRRGFKGV